MASNTLEQDSLFSLELVVDKLSIPKVACRFPAVAFRLLDFPTLIVYHVEPDLAETIKTKIATSTNYKVPPQLKELQDKEGNFQVKKGKSCLFKASPNLLQSLLSSTPLYVMLIDTYPETPRLLGNCTIPLDSAMEDVYDDICKMGVSVPSVHGGRGTYRIFNLMSTDIGSISLGYRLLSLGVGLMQHIPDRAIVKVGASPQPTPLFPDAKQSSKEAKDVMILEDLETADKAFQVSMVDPEVQKFEKQAMSSQTEIETRDTIATQTVKSKGRKKKVKHQIKTESPAVYNEYDNVFITNTVCPPPLFYNSEAPEKSEDTMEFYDNVPDVKNMAQDNESEDEWLSDDSTIRPEDRYSDSEFDDKPVEKVVKKKSPVTKSNMAKSYANVQNQFSGLMQGKPGQKGFPILNALMKEIISLHGGQIPSQMQDIQVAKPQTPRMGSPRLRRAIEAEKHREEALKKLATARQVPDQEGLSPPPSPDKHSHRVCYAGPPVVPKTKSWLRQTPAPQNYAVKKNKITPGMTNTQRLRLAKTNPALLQTLERQEQERVEKWKRLRAKQGKYPGATAEVFPRMDTQDIMIEVSRHGYGYDDDHYRENLEQLDLGESGDLSHHKRPVPTPRHSVSMSKEKVIPVVTPRGSKAKKINLKVAKGGEKPGVMKVHSPSLEKVFLMPVDKEEEEQSLKSDSHSTQIEVHVPSASIHDNDNASEATSFYDSDIDEAPRARDFGKTKTLNNAGFPMGGMSTDYSEDFETHTGRTAEPELRRVVETYSDEESEQDQVETLEGGVPELRMVVDKYSDDDEESKSFHSAKSQESAINTHAKLNNSVLNPPSSVMSPTTISHKAPNLNTGTREPFAASSTTIDDAEPSIAEDIGPSSLTRAERRVAAPRSALESQSHHSILTDSVSSYVPSEEVVIPPVRPSTAGEYSDEFEDISEEVLPDAKYMKDLKVDPKAKMGYTWSGEF